MKEKIARAVHIEVVGFGKLEEAERSEMASQASIPEPFGDAESEEQSTEGKAHERDDEGEPAGVGVRAGGAESAKKRLKDESGEQAGADHG